MVGWGFRPVVFVLDNSGYLIERLLCTNPSIAYNDIAPWRYAELPHALGCDGWFTARVTTHVESWTRRWNKRRIATRHLILKW